VIGEVQEDSSTQELLSRTEIAPPEVGSWWPIGL
jgi:hypothetical protein